VSGCGVVGGSGGIGASEAHVFILLFGEPSAFDDAGGHYGIISEVAGAAYCPGPQTNPPSFRLCVGKPRVDNQYLFPLDGYTEIEPGQAATVHYTLRGGGGGGKKYRNDDLAQEIERSVKEEDRRLFPSGRFVQNRFTFR
jgi:hypothetical protein